jgi:hypothetical protein
VILLATVVWPLLMGFLLARALGRDLGLPLQVCLGAGLGIGVVSCCFFLALENGAPSLLFELLLLAGLGAACGLRWRTGARRKAAPSPVPGWLSGALGVVLLSDAYGFYALTSARPHGDWDGWAIWNLHARFLATPYWRDLFSRAIPWTHPDYPLLLPGFIARVWSALGEWDIAVPAVVALLFTFGAVGLLGGAVAALKNRTEGLLAALVLAATPAFILRGSSQYADVPVSFFILATLALLALEDRAWPEARGLSVLAGVSAGMAAWTKNEGLLLVAVVAPIQALAAWRRRGARAAAVRTGWFAAGLAPILAMVLYFRFTLAPPNQQIGGRPAARLAAQLGDPHRWTVMVVELAKDVVRFGGLPVGLPILLAAYLICTGLDWKSRRAHIPATAATLALLVAGYSVACVVSPLEILWQTNGALNRLLEQLWPGTVFLVFLTARSGAQVEG